MRHEICTRASDPDSSSRAFPWPVLEAGNGSFQHGIYSAVCEDKEPGQSFLLRHKIQGAALIEKWMEQGKLCFVCSVAAPRSMYRVLHKSLTPKHLIEWKQEYLGEFPMFTPMIVARDDIDHIAEADSDGLNRIWDNKHLQLPKGARVAIGHTFMFKSGIEGLLDFNRDENLENGRFRVAESAEDGFKFKVHLAPDLYSYLQYHRRDESAGKNIMVHVVSIALSILQKDYSEDEENEGWKSFRNLVGLAELLQQKDLGHWSYKEFRPELASTGLYPHKLPTESVQ